MEKITNERIAKALCYARNTKSRLCFDALDAEEKEKWNKIQDLLLDSNANLTLLKEKGVDDATIGVCSLYTFNEDYNLSVYFEELQKDLMNMEKQKLAQTIANCKSDASFSKFTREFSHLEEKYELPVEFDSISFEELFPENLQGLPWFSDGLNALTQGLPVGKCVGIVAGVNTGKTIYLSETAVNLARNKHKVLYLYNEMSKDEIWNNLYTIFEGIQLQTTDKSKYNIESFKKLTKYIQTKQVKTHMNPVLAAEELIHIMKQTDAEVVILDYLQLNVEYGDSSNLSYSYDTLLDMVVHFVEQQNKMNFLFSVQASEQHFSYADRMKMDSKARGCTQIHKHLNSWIGLTTFPEDNRWEDFLAFYRNHPFYDVAKNKKNIRCFTILKARGNKSQYKSYTVYQGYDFNTQETYTVGISSNEYNKPLFLQCGYNEEGEFWWKDEPLTPAQGVTNRRIADNEEDDDI